MEHGNGDERDDRQQRADPQHHPEHADDRQRRCEQLAESLLQGRRDVVDVVGDPAQQVTVRMAVKVLQGETPELRLDITAHTEHGSLRQRPP